MDGFHSENSGGVVEKITDNYFVSTEANFKINYEQETLRAFNITENSLPIFENNYSQEDNN